MLGHTLGLRPGGSSTTSSATIWEMSFMRVPRRWRSPRCAIRLSFSISSATFPLYPATVRALPSGATHGRKMPVLKEATQLMLKVMSL